MTFKKLQANNNFSNPSPNGKFRPTAGRTSTRPSFSSLSTYSTNRSDISVTLPAQSNLRLKDETRRVKSREEMRRRGREERGEHTFSRKLHRFLLIFLLDLNFLLNLLPPNSLHLLLNQPQSFIPFPFPPIHLSLPEVFNFFSDLVGHLGRDPVSSC
jgi:hypothetical protein